MVLEVTWCRVAGMVAVIVSEARRLTVSDLDRDVAVFRSAQHHARSGPRTHQQLQPEAQVESDQAEATRDL